MSNQKPIQQNLLIIPNFEEFCGQLYERLYILLKQNNLFTGKFTFLANLIDRSNVYSVVRKRLKYVGINSQRLYLTSYVERESIRFEKYWNYLDAAILRTDEEDIAEGREEQALESAKLFNEIKDGKLFAKDIKVGYLREYFDYENTRNYFPNDNNDDIYIGPFKSKNQAAEFPILNQYFNIETDHYLSIPLIRFGHFDGILHFIFTPKDIYTDIITDEGKKQRQKNINQLITICSNIYEEWILDWDLFGKNKFKDTYINLIELTKDEYYEKINENPILRELKFPQYYRQSYKYLQNKLNQNIEIASTIKEQYRRTAIITILIDSFAHNISAHSLTVLKWWFQQRAKLRYQTKKDIRDLNIIIEKTLLETASLVNGLSYTFNSGREQDLELKLQKLEKKIEDAAQNAIKLRQKINQPEISDPEGIPVENAVIATKQSLSNEIYPLLKFLLEKGAFWSGMIRRRNFGGKIDNLFNALWEDFVNNPLYLGTIAYSEGVSKLHVNLSIIDDSKEERRGNFYRKKHYVKNSEGIILNGRFFTIDLSAKESEQIDKEGWDEILEEYPEFESKSYFVQVGKKYKAFRDYLKNCGVFFPSGVVGKHALFTIIENEIRNVKHYSLSDRLKMQKEGLTLNISIEEKHLKFEDINTFKQRELYKVGLWISYPQNITKNILVNRLKKLGVDIMDEEFNPRLGGTYQDKICAAMLMNNKFISVQDLESNRAKRYYPWLKFSQVMLPKNDFQDFQEEFEISLRRYRGVKEIQELLHESKNISEEFTQSFVEKQGYIAKIFHLWKGTELYEVKTKDNMNFSWENLLRFKFTNLLGMSKSEYQAYFMDKKIRQEPPIRLINNESVKDIQSAYMVWLKKWMKNEDDFRIKIEIDKEKAAQIIYKNEKLIWASHALNKNLLNDSRISQLPSQTITLAHAGTSKNEKEGNYRSHGMLKQYFCNGEDIADASIENQKLAELFEMLITRICIFDNRIVKRVNKNKIKYYKDILNCTFYEENLDNWETAKNENIHQYHFFVMHLSFVEALKNEKGKQYGEDNIGEFIEKEILGKYGLSKIGDNFILVITTGRGRTTWWTKLEEDKPEYTPFTTYRPVESLIAAVENAVSKKDDIDLKMGLTQILFGS